MMDDKERGQICQTGPDQPSCPDRARPADQPTRQNRARPSPTVRPSPTDPRPARPAQPGPPSPASEKDYDSEADYYAEAEATLAVLDTSARSPAALPVPLPAARGAAAAFAASTHAHGLRWYVITGGPHQGVYSTYDYDRDIRPLAERQPGARCIRADSELHAQRLYAQATRPPTDPSPTRHTPLPLPTVAEAPSGTTPAPLPSLLQPTPTKPESGPLVTPPPTGPAAHAPAQRLPFTTLVGGGGALALALLVVVCFPSASTAVLYSSVTLGSVMRPEEAIAAFGPRTPPALTPTLAALADNPAIMLLAAGYLMYWGVLLAIDRLPRTPHALGRGPLALARMLAALTRAMFHLATGTAHLAGTIAVVYVVSRLVTGGDATHAPAYRHSPTAERILLSTATYAPAIHQSATRIVGDYCATELNVEGVAVVCGLCIVRGHIR